MNKETYPVETTLDPETGDLLLCSGKQDGWSFYSEMRIPATKLDWLQAKSKALRGLHAEEK